MKRLLAGLMALLACGTVLVAAPRKPQPSSAPQFSIADVSVSEEAGQVTLTITRSGSTRSGSTVIAATAPGTAHSGIDYNTRTQTITFSKSQTRATFVVNLVNDGFHEGVEQFTVSLTAGSNARISRSPATVTIADSDNESVPTQTCPNGEVIPQSDTCPPLIPDVPDPGPTTGGGPTGLTAIPTTDFNVNDALTPTWGTGEIPESNSTHDIIGAFRFICGAGQLAYDDPVVYPGQKGASHLHQFYGHMGANFNSTFASLRASGDSTCNSTNKMDGTGKAANRSAYWIPAMLDGKGHVVQPDYVQVYYKGRPTGNIECQSITKRATGAGICANIPNGLRFINGYDMLNQTLATGFDRPQFHCEGTGASGTASYSITQAKANGCPAGSRLAVSMQSKLCWNGADLDSSNHRSHMTDMVRDNDAGTSGCPSSHPYWLPQLTLTFFYSVEVGDDLSLWEPSSDAHARMANPSLEHGQSFHFDYFEAWDATVKAMWFDNCITGFRNGSGGDLCNGKQLKGASVPYYNGVPQWKNPNRLVPIPVNN